MVFTSSDDENTRGHAVNERSNTESRSSTKTRRSVDSASTTRIPQPIFAFEMSPKVSSIDRDELAEWLKLGKEYDETMTEQCKDGKEDFGTVMKRVKNSFFEYLLETLCEVSWGVSVDEVTDDFLLEHIHAITDSYQNRVVQTHLSTSASGGIIEHRALSRERNLNRKQKPWEQPHPFQKNKRQITGQQQKADKFQKRGKVVQPAAESSGDKKDQPGQKGAPMTGCFHCGGAHYLSGCPTATKEDR
ncbi:unnamed protein product [Phytophthora fragariaefolia]|uniref:Unnamed protein product n=1 Tax=Phytophthora fragariaefolia TaxID=1490495 RepID=A0A9W6Y2U7_9STRA|nr:unnamed protein product [Phytophthora fragariaefolia]